MKHIDNISILLLILSFAIHYLSIHFRIKIANTLKIFDTPNEKRKIHKKKVPKTAAFWIMPLSFFYLLSNLYLDFFNYNFSVILIGTLLIFCLGLLDDILLLSSYKKLFLSFLISLITISLSENLIIYKFYLDTYDTFFLLKNFSIFFTAFCIILFLNAINLSDGINGLAIGIILFSLLHIFIQNQFFTYSFFIIIIICNLIISFIYNLKQKHFLGDNGSLSLAMLLALLVISNVNVSINNHSTPLSAEKIFILFLFPGVDMIRLFFERCFKKKDPFFPDNNHLHHFLIKKYSLKNSLFIYFFMMNVPIILTWYLNFKSIYIISTTIIFYIFFLYKLRKL